MNTVLDELKGMMVNNQRIHTSRRQRFAFGFNDLERLPELRKKLADQEQHLQTWLAGLIIGGIGRLEVTTQKILELLKDQNVVRGDQPSETPRIIEDSVKTEIERSAISGENKQVMLALAKRYLQADHVERASLESEIRTSIPQDQSATPVSVGEKTSRTAPKVSLNSAHMVSNPGVTPSNSREERIKRGEYRILCVDGANTGES